jgi:DNA-binding GntR family transcriptional regulator
LAVVKLDMFMTAAEIAEALGVGMSYKLRTAIARLVRLGRLEKAHRASCIVPSAAMAAAEGIDDEPCASLPASVGQSRLTA